MRFMETPDTQFPLGNTHKPTSDNERYVNYVAHFSWVLLGVRLIGSSVSVVVDQALLASR